MLSNIKCYLLSQSKSHAFFNLTCMSQVISGGTNELLYSDWYWYDIKDILRLASISLVCPLYSKCVL